MRENVKVVLKKLCFIRQRSTFGRMDELEKEMSRQQKTMINRWRQDIEKTRISY
jgi:hypothetical protein